MTIRLEKDVDWRKVSEFTLLDGVKAGSPGAKREWARRKLTPGVDADLANWNPADHPRNPANGRFIDKGALLGALVRRLDRDDARPERVAPEPPRFSADTPPPPNPPFVFNGTEVLREDALYQIGLASGWSYQDAAGGVQTADFERSITEQRSAQIAAGVWMQNTDPFSPREDQFAVSTYSEYQMPEEYQRINAALRTGEPNDYYPDPDLVRQSVGRMFEKGGWTTEAPMSTYRAYKSLPRTDDWAERLTPGTVLRDKGILSSTAHPRFAQGWLMRGLAGREQRSPGTSDVVMEIRVPKGQRIVGGNVNFIETMLPPDTRLKVVSAEVRSADAVNPLDSGQTGDFQYTHVVAEVMP